MRCWRYWVPAAVALMFLLCVAGTDMEHLKAENLHLLPPEEQNMVRNRDMRGTFVRVACRFQFDLSSLLSI